MEIEAPTFNALNLAQKRALILRDQLRWTDSHHLDGFIDGLARPEPPIYQSTKGVTKPDLILVKFKANATRFDLGNVIFPEDDRGVLHAYLVFKEGEVKMYTEEPLPQGEGNFNHIAIHNFIAGTMVPMFKDKINLVMERISKYNEARRFAYSSPIIVIVDTASEETCTSLQPPLSSLGLEPSPAGNHYDRDPDTPIIPHIINKQSHTGLSSIPASLKISSFNSVPEQVKYALFDSITQAAFPNLDSLIVASRNVVSAYAASGNNSTETHKAIFKLRDILQDIDPEFVVKPSNTPAKARRHLLGQTQSGTRSTQVASTSPSQVNVGTTTRTLHKAPSFSGQKGQNAELTTSNKGMNKVNKVLDTGSTQDSVSGSSHSSESSSGEDEIPAQRPLDLPSCQDQNHASPAASSIRFARTTVEAHLLSHRLPAAPRDQSTGFYQVTSTAASRNPLPASTLAIVKSPMTKSPVARPFSNTASPFSPPTPKPPVSAHSAKRKASPSCAPLPAKRKYLDRYTTAQLRDKHHVIKTSILREWGGMDPNVAPRQYLELLQSLEVELERREGDGTLGIARVKEAEKADSSKGKVLSEEMDYSRSEKKGTSAQIRTENGFSRSSQPTIPYLGNSTLGAEKNVNLDSVQP